MLRETKARLLTALTAVLVTVLAAVFSLLSNPPPSNAQGSAARPAPADPRAETGRKAYDRLGCAGCHSIAGQGSPGSPLDGVSDRLDAVMLEAWIVGGEAARGQLPASIVRMKSRYAADPELGALTAYLQTLRAAKPQEGVPPASK